MDSSKSDVDFDSYWEEEARNPNRNRIRIGRQYQAQVTPLLKPGENDGRNLEDLETLSWNSRNQLNNLQLDHYFSIANSIGLFVQSIDTCHEGLEDEEGEGDDQEERPFEILQLGPSNASEDSNSIFGTSHSVTTPEKQSITTRQQRLQQQRELQSTVEPEPGTSSPLKHTSNVRIQNALKGLSAFISSHHSPHKDKHCKSTNVNTENPPIDLGSSEGYSLKKLSELLMGKWTPNEAQIFAKALQVCGKNFSAIKKDYLPWKSVRSIIEFYYYSVDKDNEQKKKSPTKHLDKQNKSPLDENKRKRSSKDDGPESSYKSTDKQDVQETNSNGTSDNLATDSQPDSAKSCSNQEDSKGDLNCTDTTFLVKSNNTQNGSLADDVTLTKTINGNINGNHVLINDNKRNSVPGQEVRPTKAKPIVQNDNPTDGDDNTLSNSTLGSLNLYLHGELVLKLNAQQQVSGQKWVESMEMPPKKKRSMMANGLSSSGRLSSLKRSIDSKGSGSVHVFKEDIDDLSTCGGDVSGSDDDSMTSNESSSLVASSPSSSSTINSAAKKARVKVENLSSAASNGTSISPPNTNRKSDTSGSGSHKQRTDSPSVIDSETELKKKLLEANLNLLRMENGHLPLLFNSSTVGGGLFEPPKAHSNAAAISPQYPPHHPLHVVNVSPVKNISKSSEPTMNGHANGFSTGPVDLTRKPTNGHSSELPSSPSLHSPSRQRNSHSNSSSMPKAAHEASNSSISASRLVSNSLGLFSLPAPPPPHVPVSPNGHNKHLKKSLIRTGGVQFAK